jgi:hypothetical protein
MWTVVMGAVPKRGAVTGDYRRETGRMASTAPAAAPAAHDPAVTSWEFLNTDRWIMLGKAPRGRRDVVVPLHRTPKYEVMLPQILEMAEAGSGFDRLARKMKVSRGTVLRAYDFANRDKAAAAAREGRKPTRPRCAHGRRPDCVTDAAQSPPARRHCEFPPLQATPAGEDSALQDRLRAPRRLA